MPIYDLAPLDDADRKTRQGVARDGVVERLVDGGCVDRPGFHNLRGNHRGQCRQQDKGEHWQVRTCVFHAGSPSCPSRTTCPRAQRSEEQTAELQSLMRRSYAVVGLKKKKRKVEEQKKKRQIAQQEG